MCVWVISDHNFIYNTETDLLPEWLIDRRSLPEIVSTSILARTSIEPTEQQTPLRGKVDRVPSQDKK